MEGFHEFWMKQSEAYRRAAGYGQFILNQPELDLLWGVEEITEEDENGGTNSTEDDNRG